MSKELINATERELSDWPGSSFDVLPDGGKHARMAIKYNDQSRLVVFAHTPSDNRAVPNHLAVVRKQLRDMGAQKAKFIVEQPKPKTPRSAPVAATQKPFTELEEIMAAPAKKIENIMNAVQSLTYREMLELSEALSSVATAQHLRRTDVHGWARMLQRASEIFA